MEQNKKGVISKKGHFVTRRNVVQKKTIGTAALRANVPNAQRCRALSAEAEMTKLPSRSPTFRAQTPSPQALVAVSRTCSTARPELMMKMPWGGSLHFCPIRDQDSSFRSSVGCANPSANTISEVWQ